MKKSLGSFLITGLGLALLIYTGSRSIDFIGLTLPPDKQIVAVVALAALDGGLIFWLISFMYSSHGKQRPIALIMIVIDFIGVCYLFTLDTLYNTGLAGMTSKMSAGDIQTAVIGMSFVIAANVGGVVMHHLADPENLRRMAEEEARDKIEELALKEIARNAAELASEVAPQMGKSWKAEYLANYQIMSNGRKKALPEFQVMNATVKIPEVVLPENKAELPESARVLPEKINPTAPAPKGSRKTRS